MLIFFWNVEETGSEVSAAYMLAPLATRGHHIIEQPKGPGPFSLFNRFVNLFRRN